MDELARFDEVYAQSYARVVTAVAAVAGSFAEAEECAQEAFLRAYADWPRVSRHVNPVGWVTLTGTRLATDRWRRRAYGRRRQHLVDGTGRDPTVATELAELRSDLSTALAQLPVAEREVLVLHYLLDLPVSDIAALTGRPTGTVKSHLSRGRNRLAANVEAP